MSQPLDEQQMRDAWDTAVQDCLTGHENCSYGGMTPQTGYWLQAEGCQLNHGERCVWCGGEAETGFSNWADDGFSIYRVPACEGCAQQWVRFDVRWVRSIADEEPTP
jgi:hypothetical protein